MAKNKVNISFIDTNRIKSLSGKKTLELLKEVQKGNKDAREEVAYGNIKLVLSVVNRFAKRTDNLDDLFQVGFIGLLKAIDHFDLSLDVAFSTYAVPMIEGEIRRYLRDDSFLRVSRQVKDLSYRLLKAKEDSLNEYGYLPSIEELSKMVDVSKNKVIEAIDVNLPLQSLEDPIFNDFDDSLLLQDTLASLEEEKKSTYRYLYEGIEKLSPLEKDIIHSRYFEGKSQIEIASRLHISQAQVSRLEKGALKILKKYV